MQNKIIIFTGPSGVGKATIEKELFKMPDLALKLSVSATTRAPRQNEVNGREYYFISHAEFSEKIKNHEFVEYSEHFSNKYGTLKSELQKILASGQNPFLEIETNGAKNIMNQVLGQDLVAIFIAPPSPKALIRRIRQRGSETESQLQERVSRLEEELSHQNLFQHIVVNDNIKETIQKIRNILLQELC